VYHNYVQNPGFRSRAGSIESELVVDLRF
jgi:hypothetical protein